MISIGSWLITDLISSFDHKKRWPDRSGRGAGHAALRAYWAKALARQPDLTFRAVTVFEGFEMLVIAYQNHAGIMAVETFCFDAAG